MKGFARLTAPFDGIVTARNTDVGAGQRRQRRRLRNCSSSPTRSACASTCRAAELRAERTARHEGDVERAGISDKTYTAEVEASSQAVSAASGTTQMQLLVDNPGGELPPGGYASVRLDLKNRSDVLSVPASALIINAKGISVATVDAEDKIVIKPVTIARDLGKTIEISSGLAAGDRVVENPPDGVVTGTQVRIAGAQPKVRCRGGKRQESERLKGRALPRALDCACRATILRR